MKQFLVVFFLIQIPFAGYAQFSISPEGLLPRERTLPIQSLEEKGNLNRYLTYKSYNFKGERENRVFTFKGREGSVRYKYSFEIVNNLENDSTKVSYKPMMLQTKGKGVKTKYDFENEMEGVLRAFYDDKAEKAILNNANRANVERIMNKHYSDLSNRFGSKPSKMDLNDGGFETVQVNYLTKAGTELLISNNRKTIGSVLGIGGALLATIGALNSDENTNGVPVLSLIGGGAMFIGGVAYITHLGPEKRAANFLIKAGQVNGK